MNTKNKVANYTNYEARFTPHSTLYQQSGKLYQFIFSKLNIVKVLALTVHIVCGFFEHKKVCDIRRSCFCYLILNGHAIRLSVYNPADGTLISDQIPIAGEDDIDRAIEAAQAAFSPKSEWRVMSDFDRQKALLKFADLIEANREQLASLTRVTLGAPYNPFGKSEVDTAIGCFRCMYLISSIS